LDNSVEVVVKTEEVVRIGEIGSRWYRQGRALEAIPLVEVLTIRFLDTVLQPTYHLH